MSVKEHDFTSLACIFAQLLPRIREAAKKLGYAIAIHGSMHTDFDLVAIPWIEEAASPEELVQMVAKAVHGFVIGVNESTQEFERGEVQPGHKMPHGRVAWNICWGGEIRIDLSIMPRSEPCPQRPDLTLFSL